MISQQLREQRKQRGLTQRAVAECLGMVEQQYQAYELGRKKPTIDNLIILADYFDVSIDYLVGRTDNPTVTR